MPCLCVNLGWVTSTATLRVGSYNVTHHYMGVLRKKIVVGIFSVWIFGLLHERYNLNLSILSLEDLFTERVLFWILLSEKIKNGHQTLYL